MASTEQNFDGLFYCWLEMMKGMPASPFLESGCETRVTPYVAAHLNPDGDQEPETESKRLVFVGFAKLNELGQRIITINCSLAGCMRNILVSRDFTRELKDVHDVVLNLVRHAVEEHVRMPYTEGISGHRRVAVNYESFLSDDPNFSGRIDFLRLRDERVYPNGMRACVMARQRNTYPHRVMYELVYPYTWVPGVDAAGDVIDEKFLNEDELVQVMMKEFFTSDRIEWMMRQFFKSRHEMKAKEDRRVFNRQLENTVVNNKGLFEDVFEPGAAGITWQPEPNVCFKAFVMISHPRLGKISPWRGLPEDLIQRIASLCLVPIY